MVNKVFLLISPSSYSPSVINVILLGSSLEHYDSQQNSGDNKYKATFPKIVFLLYLLFCPWTVVRVVHMLNILTSDGKMCSHTRGKCCLWVGRCHPL